MAPFCLSFPPCKVRGGGLRGLGRTFADEPSKRDSPLAWGLPLPAHPLGHQGGVLWDNRPLLWGGGSRATCSWGCKASGLLNCGGNSLSPVVAGASKGRLDCV